MPSYKNKDSKKTENLDILLSEVHFNEFEAYAKVHNTSRPAIIESYIDNMRLPKEPKQASELQTKFIELEEKRYGCRITKRRAEKLQKYAEVWGISLADVKRVIAKYIVRLLEDYKRGIKPAK